MKKEFLYASMALGLMFTACNSDDIITPEEPGSGVAEADQTLYVKFAIRGASSGSGTRAGNTGDPEEGNGANGDFADGTGESDVKDAYFVFYNEDGIGVGDPVRVTLGTSTTATGADGTVEKYYQSTASVSLLKDQKLPTQVVCYINPSTPADLTKPLYEIQTVTRENVVATEGTTKYFPMSNSVYYKAGEDGSVADGTLPTTAVDVSGKLYDTAAKAEENPAVDIYVERYASKLAFSTTGVEPYVTNTLLYGANGATTTPAVKLTFVPEYWALNAESKEEYVIKSFRMPSVTGAMLTDNYKYGGADGANTAINITQEGNLLSAANQWKWNNSGYHRSYWGCSTAYFVSEYPEVAGDLNPATHPQIYYNYNDLATKGFAATNTTPQYFKETTVGLRALQSKNPAAATPSVILVGHYTMTVGTSTDVVKSAFYTYTRNMTDGKPTVFFPANSTTGASMVSGGESMLKRFIMELSCLFKKSTVDGKTVWSRYDPTDATDFNTLVSALEIEYPAADVKGAMKVPARYRTLQFKNVAAAANIYVATGQGYKSVVDDPAEGVELAAGTITLATANQVLMQQVGFANYYESTEVDTDDNAGGKAYFSIPVLHYGWYRPGNPNRVDGNLPNKIDWSKAMVGDVGMVRNHTYQVNVTKISGLATGIGGYNDPIVPPADTQEQYISYKVNILQWAVVPTQNVELN